MRGIDRADIIEIIESDIIPEYAHDVINPIFHKYALIGGMPQLVQEYANHGDVTQLLPIYEYILKGYQESAENMHLEALEPS